MVRKYHLRTFNCPSFIITMFCIRYYRKKVATKANMNVLFTFNLTLFFRFFNLCVLYGIICSQFVEPAARGFLLSCCNSEIFQPILLEKAFFLLDNWIQLIFFKENMYLFERSFNVLFYFIEVLA